MAEWIEGMIADWSAHPQSGSLVYLIESVRPKGDHSWDVSFRSLDKWAAYPYQGMGRPVCHVREPTDEECARIAACYLLGKPPEDA